MIAITGSTGQLGRLVIKELLKKVPAEQIVAVVRSPAKADELTQRGVQVRQGDYDQPDTLIAAVIDAAKRAGVTLLAYTSLLHADKPVGARRGASRHRSPAGGGNQPSVGAGRVVVNLPQAEYQALLEQWVYRHRWRRCWPIRKAVPRAAAYSMTGSN